MPQLRHFRKKLTPKAENAYASAGIVVAAVGSRREKPAGGVFSWRDISAVEKGIGVRPLADQRGVAVTYRA